jgi:hypothetical protein
MVFAELFGMMINVCADDFAAIDLVSRSAAKRAKGDENVTGAGAAWSDGGAAKGAEWC